MNLLWFLKKRNSREEARKRLQNIVGSRRNEVNIRSGAIPLKEFVGNEMKIKKDIIKWAVETFKVDESRIKVEFQEREGYVIIITNVSFQ